MLDSEVRAHAGATDFLQAERERHDFVNVWPFRLVRIDDDGHEGRQGLLRRRRGLGHAGRVYARHALYAVHRRKNLGQRDRRPAGGREEAGHAADWLGYVGVDDVDATAARIKRLGGTVYVEPTDVPNISRICVAVDRQMAMIALLKWLTPGQEPAALSAPGRVGWHELLAADREQAFAFYAELFGWQKADADTGAVGTYQMFSAGGETIGGMFTKQPEMPVPYWLYYFNVGDIDVAMRRVKAGGGGIRSSPVEVPGGSWVVQCTDPQSAIFAL